MNKLAKIKYITLPIVIVAGLLSAVTALKAFATDPDPNKIDDNIPMPTCYEAAAPPLNQDQVDNLQNQLDSLEKQHQDNKIDDKTYQIRKNDIELRLEHYQ